MNPFVRLLLSFSLFLSAAIQTRGATNFERLADLNPGSVGSFPSNFTAYAGNLYFSAYTLSTGRELWKYDGTNVTLVADIDETKDVLLDGTVAGNDSLPSFLTVFDGLLFFSAYDSHRGDELWKHNGTNVTRVADISPDANDTVKPSPNSSWPAELTVLGNALYFSANNGTAIPNYELWKYDGALTSRVANIHPDIGTNYSSYPNNLTAFKNALYFMANDGAHGYELWKHDSTGTVLLSDINPGSETNSSFPKKFTAFQDQLFFAALRDDIGYELWKTDGTNTTLAADINTGADSSFPNYLTVFNNTLYFQAADASHGSELWKFDGNTASVAADINPAGDAFPKNLTVFGSQLFFAANDGVHGWELWKFDGATAELVTDLNPSGDAFPENLLVFDGVLYFTATTPDTGYELWKYDGTNVTLAADINPGPGDSFPQFLTAFNGRIFFRAAGNGGNDFEPWSYTPETVPPAYITPTNLKIELLGTGIRLTWTTSAGSTNIVQSADNIAGPFTDLSPQISPSGSGEVTTEFTDTGAAANAGTRFYRIKRL
jgi:ELWxxDGT repeat protein